MITARFCVAVALAVVISFATPACKKSKSNDRAATASTVGKEKHTKTKAHKRQKKEERAKEGKTKATPVPAKP